MLQQNFGSFCEMCLSWEPPFCFTQKHNYLSLRGRSGLYRSLIPFLPLASGFSPSLFSSSSPPPPSFPSQSADGICKTSHYKIKKQDDTCPCWNISCWINKTRLEWLFHLSRLTCWGHICRLWCQADGWSSWCLSSRCLMYRTVCLCQVLSPHWHFGYCDLNLFLLYTHIQKLLFLSVFEHNSKAKLYIV